MDSVAAQPSPHHIASSSRNPANRLKHLLNPLRRPSSTRDLRQRSDFASYSSAPLDITASPNDAQNQFGQRSSAVSYTPPATFGFSSNRTRVSRALAESGARSKSSFQGNSEDFIPYRGPISPPSLNNLSDHLSDRRQDVAGPSNERWFLDPERQYQARPQVEGRSSFLRDDSGAGWAERGNRNKRVKVPRYEDIEPDLLGLGLGMGQSGSSRKETGSSSDVEGRTKRSLLGSGLPSAYTHGGNVPIADSSVPLRSVANQSYLPSLLRFDRESVGQNAPTRTREVVHPAQGIDVLPKTASTSLPKASSVGGSPAMKFPTLMKQIEMADAHYRGVAGSVNSSDGHDSSLIFNGSASTSMTSLRDYPSFHGKRRPSQELASSKPSTTRPRAYTASSQTARKGKEKMEEQEASFPDPSVTARDFVEEKKRDLIVSPESAWTKSEMSSLDLPVKYPLGNLAANRTLSPISASTPGHQHGPPSDYEVSFLGKGQEKRMSRMIEANENYKSLQQMHFDELKTHSTDIAGWWDTKNGCERVLMPRPLLGKDDLKEKSNSSAVAFERHRRLQTQSNPQLSDSAKAQEMLGSRFRRSHEKGESGGLFHHRMPPPTPEMNQGATLAPVTIPVRRSSRSKRLNGTTPTPSSIPALNSHLLSDGSDEEDDLATVLAQGRALDEEREKWREQHRKSIGKSKSHDMIRAAASSSKSGGDGVKAKRVHYREPLPDLKTFHKYADKNVAGKSDLLSQTGGTSNTRRGTEKGLLEEGGERRGKSSTACIPFPSLLSSRGHQRRRSKSQESIRSLFHVDSCFPSIRRQRSQTMTAVDESASRRMSQDRLDVDHHYRRNRSSSTQSHVVSDTPVVISRLSMPSERKREKGEVDRGGSPLSIANSQAVNARKQVDSSPQSNAYGIAFSAPRPDIGQTVPKDPTFFAGRHATKIGYHHPTGSDDLRSMLSSTPTSTRGQEERSLAKSSSPVIMAPRDFESGRRLSVRSSSLGPNRGTPKIDENHRQMETSTQSPVSEVMEQQRSLPVPPRRQRSIRANSTSESTDETSSSGLQPPSPSLSNIPFVAMEGFATSSDAMILPTLNRLRVSDGDRIQDRLLSPGSEANILPRVDRSIGIEERLTGSFRQSRGDARGRGFKGSFVQPSSSSSDDSNYSPRSIAARELWNTDEHEEEAFSGLFFKPPVMSSSRLGQAMVIGSSLRDETDTSRSESEATTATPTKNKNRKVAGETLQGPQSMSNDSAYQMSLKDRRNSEDVEKLVGSYLEKPERAMPGGFVEAAWNESTTDVYLTSPQLREEAVKLGRIDHRRPVIQQGYRGNDGGDASSEDEEEAGKEEEEEEGGKRRPKPRARLSSFAASLILNADGEEMSPGS
ncbi:hypothetical protein CBS101457_002217 [Exobasidium rhododendri]|nr:hypothetical protein CBS101457_002217 [Exobasidium rhododendri]